MNVEALFILHLAPGVDFYDVERFILREVPPRLQAQARVTRAVTTYPDGQITRHYKAYVPSLPASDIDLVRDAKIKDRAHLEGLGVMVTQYRPLPEIPQKNARPGWREPSGMGVAGKRHGALTRPQNCQEKAIPGLGSPRRA